MPVPSLLSIDPDKLFEQSSIQEIEDVQKKLQNEIDRKREELRTMVGERYRDLIEAADTISQMKTLSEKIIDDVKKIKMATAELQEKQVSGFKIEFSSKDSRGDNSQSCIAAQIKILINVVEYIWDAINASDFTRATLLFLLARYVKTSLEINPNCNTAHYFPLVSRHWSSMVHFKDTILDRAEGTLRCQHDPQVSCSALLSLALLRSLSARQLLQHYLSLRFLAVQSLLSTQHMIDSDSVKHRLSHSYDLLVNSITVVSQCFVEHLYGKEGQLWVELERRVGPHSLPTVSLLDDNSDVPTHLLLPNITQFRPSLGQNLEPLSEEEVQQEVSEWLSRVRECVREQGGKLLQHLSSLRGLQGLRDPPMVCEEWALIAQRMLRLPSVDLWSDLYRSLITVRAQQLLSVHWDAALKTLQQQIQQNYQAAVSDTKQSEVNLLWYMWREHSSTGDLNTIKGEARGITPRVSQLCSVLEQKLSSLLQDLAVLCPEQEVDSAMLAISHTLKTHQQTLCAHFITRVAQFAGSLVEETVSEDSEPGVLLLAKFLQSVSELCPSLNRGLSPADTKSVSLLQTECVRAYKAWLTLASARMLKHVSEKLGTAVPDLHSMPQWEEISIEEEGESGEKLQSVLRVPCSASLSLLSAIHSITTDIGRAAVPRQISVQLWESLLKNIIDVYSKSAENNLTQTQYLQMLLDIKYLMQLFAINNSKELKTLCQEIILKLQSKVDPFDLNVFTPYINNNVRVTVQQTQALLGGGSVVSAAAPSPRSEEANRLAMSSANNTWFPLLHITAPRSSNLPVKLKSKRSERTVPASSPSDNTAKQSSASSFISMATDWFG